MTAPTPAAPETQVPGALDMDPGLRDIDPARLAALGDTALARAIALYQERLAGAGLPRSFNSSI